ncbi:hypothetical protein F9K33_08435 [bacterium]|nr:MAG: hypothetical protein F9K33_08435 [bacterium]
MFGVLRFLLLGILFYAVFKAVRFIFQMTNANRHRRQGGFQNQKHSDPSKEVKNASFKSEDVQDANFKDIK